MGLDNMPHRYPCVAENTAIKDQEGNIDCDATRQADRCPYKRDFAAAGSPQGSVIGMLGAPCWYRGKVGNYALKTLSDAGYEPPADGFYGTEGNGEKPDLSPQYCRELAQWLADHAEAYMSAVADELKAEGRTGDDAREQLEYSGQQLHYMVWWLRWVADAGGGADTWY